MSTQQSRPWWEWALSVPILIWTLGFMFTAPYFEWRYANEHGFWDWLLFGEVVALGDAMMWPVRVWREVAGFVAVFSLLAVLIVGARRVWKAIESLKETPVVNASQPETPTPPTGEPEKQSVARRVWVAAAAAGVAGLCALAWWGISRDLAGTTWQGSENLPGFGALTFEFASKGVVTMIDTRNKGPGKWVRDGSTVTITFKDCEYKGVINGDKIDGTAHFSVPVNGPSAWRFSIDRMTPGAVHRALDPQARPGEAPTAGTLNVASRQFTSLPKSESQPKSKTEGQPEIAPTTHKPMAWRWNPDRFKQTTAVATPEALAPAAESVQASALPKQEPERKPDVKETATATDVAQQRREQERADEKRHEEEQKRAVAEKQHREAEEKRATEARSAFVARQLATASLLKQLKSAGPASRDGADEKKKRPDSPITAGSASIWVKLPDAGATVFVDGQKTNATGTSRLFNTPSLDPASKYEYHIKATWVQAGRETSQERTIEISAGQKLVVDFTQSAPKTAPASGKVPSDGR